MVDFQFEHLELFDWREDEYAMYNTGSDFVQALLSMEKNGECFTAMHDGRIVMIFGIIRMSEKTGYAFSIFSRHASGCKVLCAKTIRRMLVRMMDDMSLHRLTTWNMVANPHHGRWCEWLGFKKEGVLPRYDDQGRDYVQYGLVTDGT